MTEAVIVSTAQHADRQGLSRRAQRHRRRDAARPCHRTRGQARRHRPEGSRRCGDGRGAATRFDRRQHRPQGAAPRRHPGHRRRHHDRSSMRIGPAGDRAGGALGGCSTASKSRSAVVVNRSASCRTITPTNSIWSIPSWSRSRRTSTCRCSTPPRRWPSVTASRASARTNIRWKASRRTAAAQQGGKFNDELAAITTKMGVADKATGEVTMKDITLSKDEGPASRNHRRRPRRPQGRARRRLHHHCRQRLAIIRTARRRPSS